MADVSKSLTEAAEARAEFDHYIRENTVAIVLNLKNIAPSFNTGYHFDSMITFNGKCLFSNADGVFEYGGNAFAGDNIDAYFVLPTTDLGVVNQKRLRSLFAGFESDGVIQAKVSVDGGTEQTYTLSPEGSANKEEGAEGYGKQDEKGRFITIKIMNVDGADFGFDTLDIIPFLLPRKPSRAALGT